MTGRTHSVAQRLLSALVAIPMLLLFVLPGNVGACDGNYSAADIQQWLEDEIAATHPSVSSPPSVALNADTHQIVIEDFVLDMRGEELGLSYVRLTADGTTTVEVAGELDLLGKKPRFGANVTFGFTGPDGPLDVTGITDAEVAGSSLSLDAASLDAIEDAVNTFILKSGLSISAPDGAVLQTIDIVDEGEGPRLKTTWSDGGPFYLDAAEIEEALDEMAETLATKADNYLSAETPDWAILVEFADSELRLAAEFTIFGVEVHLTGLDVGFTDLAASFAGARLSLNGAYIDFSGDATLKCRNHQPVITLTDFTLVDASPGLQKLIDACESHEATLLELLNELIASIIDASGLRCACATLESVYFAEGTLVTEEAADQTVDISLIAGWNMVSVPLEPDDLSVDAIFPDVEAVYTWNPSTKSYVVPDTIDPTKAYWVAVVTDRTIPITGTPVNGWQQDVAAGWNMVGSVEPGTVDFDEPDDDPDGGVEGFAYWWDPATKSYQNVTVIDPTRGYWVAATEACCLIVE
ncbi:MAG: hypothetical protein JW846_05340 [Dehalococcoidia bacterium]|nr:hypothetical protein [Dehalococcoidia bacterium]